MSNLIEKLRESVDEIEGVEFIVFDVVEQIIKKHELTAERLGDAMSNNINESHIAQLDLIHAFDIAGIVEELNK